MYNNSYIKIEKKLEITKNIPINKIFVKSCLIKDKKKTLSPEIFTKIKNIAKQDSKIAKKIYIFEQILALVVKTYYSNEYDISKILTQLKNIQIAEKKNQENNINKQKNSKIKKRRNKLKLTPILNKKNSDKSKSIKSGKNDSLITDLNILDYIISPLKNDFEFGKLIRIMEFKRYCYFRICDLSFWKKI